MKPVKDGVRDWKAGMTDKEMKFEKVVLEELNKIMEGRIEEPPLVVPDYFTEEDIREYLIERYMMMYPEMTEEEMMKKVELWIQAIREFEAGHCIRYGREIHEIIMTNAPLGKEAIEQGLREYFTKEYKRACPEEPEEKIAEYVEEEVRRIMEIEEDPVTFVLEARRARAEREERYRKALNE
jgi:hypothetical protein